MITSLEEFRCPEFRIYPLGDRFMVFRAGDTIGEQVERDEAITMALLRLEQDRCDTLFERRMMAGVSGKYRQIPPAGPRHIDDEA